MAKERLKSPRARLFVALDLPAEIREGLGEWQRAALAGQEALRLARPETLHITLAFLDWQPEPVAVPRNRPRLFAIDAESEETVALQARIERRLVEARLYKPEKRPFWPHLTVARVRAEKPPPGQRRRRWAKPARLDFVPEALPEALLGPFRGVRITLYRSNLRPTGAEYEPLAQTELPPEGGGKAS